MWQAKCEHCLQMVPMNEMLRVLGRQLCKPCAADEVSQYPKGQITADSILRLVDPTVCAQCGSDHGDTELPKMGSLPVCGSCEGYFRNRPYPVWLKVSFVALVALAVVCFTRNWRFMAAYREIRQANRAADRGDIEGAAALSDSAARRVPDFPALGNVANLYRGFSLLQQGKSADALHCFQAAAREPSLIGPQLARAIRVAEASIAFEKKNYDEFLTKETEIARLAPDDSTAVAGLASAYACKYAVTGSQEYRKQSLEQLDRASKRVRPDDATQFQEYANRIHHRLETREILSRAEFHKRFPAGYRSKS
jgi:tetratricopeptide (TPR) repeat protein